MGYCISLATALWWATGRIGQPFAFTCVGVTAKKALPLMCAAVWWAVAPHEREPIKLESIGWNNWLSIRYIAMAT